MQSDELIWSTISKQFCSYKVKTEVQTFCRNEYNVTGLCNRMACPLANSRYATVKEVDGILYLYMKTIERAHTPLKMWERVKLSKNYAQALEQIDTELKYWPDYLIHKCKQRVTKITQYLMRMRRLKLKATPKLVGINKKTERREARREAKAEAAARLDQAIEKELLERLRKGIYGSDGIVNDQQQAFAKAMDTIEELDGAEVDEDEEEEEDEQELEEEYEMDDDDEPEREFVSDVSEDEDDDDIEDAANFHSHNEDDDDEDDDEDDQVPANKKRSNLSKPAPTLPAKRRKGPRIEIEYEHENERQLQPQ
ncbi:Mak16 protein [Polychytrium aggregatum]|uniref:Mak16 protein n=1 Tax=Polychytrium aggregatum TaxID=110093 RepID=UPI0022FED653|nr:Mak16 protein [Polychytrium aggregatum]KAI9190837.1 Mak16 protein [Polychytrium aggregatum]